MKNTMKKGFTLIELLVVIVIIGILASISVASFNSYFAKARDTKRESAVKNMTTAITTKLALGSQDATDLSAATFIADLAAEGVSVVAPENGISYIFSAGQDDYFKIAVCREADTDVVIESQGTDNPLDPMVASCSGKTASIASGTSFTIPTP